MASYFNVRQYFCILGSIIQFKNQNLAFLKKSFEISFLFLNIQFPLECDTYFLFSKKQSLESGNQREKVLEPSPISKLKVIVIWKSNKVRLPFYLFHATLAFLLFFPFYSFNISRETRYCTECSALSLEIQNETLAAIGTLKNHLWEVLPNGTNS